MEENSEVLNETLVEKIFNQFENPNVDNLYDGKIDEELMDLCDFHKIQVSTYRDDPKLNIVRGSYGRAPQSSNYKYVIKLFLPIREFTEEDIRNIVNTFVHEFAHIIVLKGIDEMIPLKINKGTRTIIDRLSERFNLGSIPYDFNVDNITKEKATNFLNYIFNITERPIFALSIAYSCYFYRKEESAEKLFKLNKEIIIGYEYKSITNEARRQYMSRLREEKTFLFLIQYAVYFLSEHKWILKLDSFMNLIKKYEKRFKKLGDKYELSS